MEHHDYPESSKNKIQYSSKRPDAIGSYEGSIYESAWTSRVKSMRLVNTLNTANFALSLGLEIFHCSHDPSSIEDLMKNFFLNIYEKM